MALGPITLPNVVIVEANVAYPITDDAGLVSGSITLQMDADNGGKVSVGDANITPDTGTQVPPGDSAVIVPPPGMKATDEFLVSAWYVTSASAGDIVRPTILKRV